MSIKDRLAAEGGDAHRSAVQSVTAPPAAPRRRQPFAAEGLAGRSADQAAERPEAEAPRRRGLRDPNRVPFGEVTQKLAFPARPGYRNHWFNDEPGRIERAQRGGYDHVTGTDGKPISRVVGTARGGGSLIAYLMEIPIEFYNEDMELAAEERERTMASIRRGAVPNAGVEKGYVPSQGISIERR